jgi:A/G-specific adenine glycosylase
VPGTQRNPQPISEKPIVGIPARALPAFQRSLLAWFDQNKRNLAWRGTRDPYRIWVSEVMLQQTRVAAVVPYYERFLSLFPSVDDLARARRETLLRAWAGLGYYSRARNLHRAARQIVARHNSEFPRSLQAALSLPGVGHYTAAAVLSIACGQPLAVLDGNVARVLARFGALRGDLRRPRTWRRLQTSADSLLARESPGEWNQAMMELGATVCVPRTPQCSACPVRRWCRARTLGLAHLLPAERRKKRNVKLTVGAIVLLDPRGRTLLMRHGNSDGALFSNLWQFPALEATSGHGNILAERLKKYVRTNAVAEPLPIARHAVTFRDIRLAPFLVRVRKLPATEGALTPLLADLPRLAVSNATRKVAEAALRAL